MQYFIWVFFIRLFFFQFLVFSFALPRLLLFLNSPILEKMVNNESNLMVEQLIKI